MEIRGNNPKDIQHLNTLLQNYSKSWRHKLKKRILRKDEEYTRSELCEVLSYKQDNYAGELIDMLTEDGILAHAGKRETGSNTVDIYTFANSWENKLYQELKDTEWWKENREIAKGIFEKGEGRELI